jgi:hypothetical protein
LMTPCTWCSGSTFKIRSCGPIARPPSHLCGCPAGLTCCTLWACEGGVWVCGWVGVRVGGCGCVVVSFGIARSWVGIAWRQ